MTIQDICRERKSALGITSQEIADKSGVPLSTVNNFFASASKSPALYTTAPICAVLGVSLDAYFGIGDHLTATEETLQAEKDGLEKRLSNKAETIEILKKSMRIRRHLIYNLVTVIIILSITIAALLIWCVYIDMHCLNFGFWRG